MEYIEPQPNQEKNDIFIAYLACQTDEMLFLDWYAVFDEDIFLFLSVSADRIDPIPSISVMKRMQKYANLYCDKEDYSNEQLADKYDVNKNKIDNHVQKVDDTIDLEQIGVDTDKFQISFNEYLESI